MSKVVTSPVAEFPGTVTLYDPLNMAQTLGWEKALRAAHDLGEKVYLTDLNAAYLPGLLACVEAWNIAGIVNPTLETFPFSPRLTSAELIDWLIGEVSRVYNGEVADGEKNA